MQMLPAIVVHVYLLLHTLLEALQVFLNTYLGVDDSVMLTCILN